MTLECDFREWFKIVISEYNFRVWIQNMISEYDVRVSLISPGFIKTPMTDKNKFKMPFIKSSKFAAEKIYKGLIKGKSFEITFPKELTTVLKILRILPYWKYFYLISKLTKLQKR